MNSVIEEIAAERQRQIAQERKPIEHDNNHLDGELAIAAAAYALAPDRGQKVYDDMWPWSPLDDKRYKHPRRKRLVIAAALIVAEIERLDRTAHKGEVKNG